MNTKYPTQSLLVTYKSELVRRSPSQDTKIKRPTNLQDLARIVQGALLFGACFQMRGLELCRREALPILHMLAEYPTSTRGRVADVREVQ